MSVISVGNGVSEEVNSALGVGNLWLFAEEKNVAAQPHSPTNQVQTSILQIPLGEALKWYTSAKIPEGGEGFTFWPMDYNINVDVKQPFSNVIIRCKFSSFSLAENPQSDLQITAYK